MPDALSFEKLPSLSASNLPSVLFIKSASFSHLVFDELNPSRLKWRADVAYVPFTRTVEPPPLMLLLPRRTNTVAVPSPFSGIRISRKRECVCHVAACTRTNAFPPG